MSLQADLGTARREYVSTVDDSRKRIHAELDDIERHRLSNIPGTIEQKKAEANRPLLNAWKSMSTIKLLEFGGLLLKGLSRLSQNCDRHWQIGAAGRYYARSIPPRSTQCIAAWQ